MIVETGVGVYGANSYVSIGYVTDYLTQRGRATENNWSVTDDFNREAAIVSGTDYIEKRFGHRFRGRQAFKFDAVSATATVTFSGLPLVGETLELGDETYEFGTDVAIGADAAATAANLSAAIGALPSRHATAATAGAVVTLTASAPGAGGTLTRLSGTLTNVALTQFSGGRDGGTQSLSWPRSYVYDAAGVAVSGVPDLIRRANAEYAVRALSTPLLPDPSDVADTKRKLEMVGPIREEIEYQSKNSRTVEFPRYPAVDKMLRPLLLNAGGGVIRG